MLGIFGTMTLGEERSLAIIREPAFKAQIREQARISIAIERIQAAQIRLSDDAHREPNNWGIHGSLAHVSQQLEDIADFLESGD